MNREQKELTVQELKQNFADSQGSFLVSYQGLTVNEMQVLRKELRSSGGNLKVAKGRLVKLAVNDVPGVQELTPFVKEQLAVVFVAKEPSAIAKVLYDFSKKKKALSVVVGYVESRLVGKELITRLAMLPSREILLAQLCSVLSAPVASVARAIDAVAQTKSDNSPKSVEAEASNDDQAAQAENDIVEEPAQVEAGE